MRWSRSRPLLTAEQAQPIRDMIAATQESNAYSDGYMDGQMAVLEAVLGLRKDGKTLMVLGIPVHVSATWDAPEDVRAFAAQHADKARERAARRLGLQEKVPA